MAKIADPKMTAKREKAFLKQKQAKQKSDVIARLQRESEALKRKVNRNNQNESGDEGMQEQMFADAAREMQIQNLEQGMVDYNQGMDGEHHDQFMNNFPMCKCEVFSFCLTQYVVCGQLATMRTECPISPMSHAKPCRI